MKKIFVQPVDKLVGKTEIPGDKSISHRSIMLGALADGKTTAKHFLLSDDCLNTIECFKKLGVNIEVTGDEVVIHGQGIDGLKEPNDILEVGNSGTTMRLMAGILAGQSFASVLTGDATIRRRPMARVTEPLKLMGANIIGREQGNLAPLTIQGGSLKGIEYHSSVASAQVKSAILLAGLFADGWTEVKEPAKSRNHTELMLKGFQVELEESDLAVRIKGRQRLSPCDIYVPGDISSAAFLLVAGCLVPDSELTLLNVGLNHTRTGIIDVLSEMGARIEIRNRWNSGGEELGDLVVSTSSLKGVRIGGELIPRLIDEIPIIAIAAACASGVTEIRDAEELRVKESNRIAAICEQLSKLGVRIEELPDGLRIFGGKRLNGAVTQSYGDHRIALSLAIAGLVATEQVVIEGAGCIAVSFPNFVRTLENLGGKVLGQ